MKTLTPDPVLHFAELFPEYSVRLRQLGINGVPLREQALHQLGSAGFAVGGREEWKYGDIGPVVEGGFVPRASRPRTRRR